MCVVPMFAVLSSMAVTFAVLMPVIPMHVCLQSTLPVIMIALLMHFISTVYPYDSKPHVSLFILHLHVVLLFMFSALMILVITFAVRMSLVLHIILILQSSHLQ